MVWGHPSQLRLSIECVVVIRRVPSAVRKRVGGLRQVRSTEEDVDGDGVGKLEGKRKREREVKKERDIDREGERERDMLEKQRREDRDMYSYRRLKRWGGGRGTVRSEGTDKDGG